MIATGGIGKSFKVTSNSWEYSGDGQAACYAAETGRFVDEGWRIRKDGGLAKRVDAGDRLDSMQQMYPVFTEAPAKTYHLAAVMRGRTEVVNRGPENTVPSMPRRSAIASTYGSVTFVSAFVEVTGTAPGMFATQ